MDYVVVGVGGTGTQLIGPLLAYLDAHDGQGEYRLALVDGDEVEEKNFERQLFDPTHIGVNKATSVAQAYGRNSLIPVPTYLGPGNIKDIIKEKSIVLICVDNHPVRALIEDHCLTLDDVVVINGGNEEDTGSCQIWVRKDGENLTPKISFMHPEIREPGEDRAAMSCQQIAALPGGGQLITANMASATFMLNALINHHKEEVKFTEIQFSLARPQESYGWDLRTIDGWN